MYSISASYVVIILGCIYLAEVAGNELGHNFFTGEKIDLWANTVGPFSNPSETYEYYTLPMCPPRVFEKRAQKLGQALSGESAVLTEYDIPFKEPFTSKTLCDMKFTDASATTFINAIKRQYYYEFLYDDLPMFAFVGASDPDTEQYYLYTHWDFTILYNQDQVIFINLTTPESSLVEIRTPSTTFSLTYSATWKKSNVDFSERRDLYQTNLGFPYRSELQIYWIAIFNSFTCVILLTGFILMTVMRLLSRDFYDFPQYDMDMYGWKVIHGDVFRLPPFVSILCGLLGVGTQFLSVAIGTLVLSLLGAFYPSDQGNIYSSGVILYAITSGFSGFVSAKMYKEFGGKNWIWNILLVALGLFALPFACSFAFINGIALVFQVTTALPFVTVLEVFCIWLLVGIPLAVVGGLAGRRFAGKFQPPVRVRLLSRALPKLPWHRSFPVQMAIAGLLPFLAIWIELFYIYKSIWGHYYYTFFGVLCAVFFVLLLVTAGVNVALTYFLLASEEYRWWWPSFFYGGSTGIYIYIYSIWYFIVQTRMTGALQAAFYFTYLLVGCYFFFILLGTVGFFSSFLFVRRVYTRVVID